MSLALYRSISRILAGILLIFLSEKEVYGQVLKSVVYDFDGFNLNQTNLPEGDYSYGDLNYQTVVNPLAQSDQIGDRSLRLDITWNNGYAAFGRGISRFIEFDPEQDIFNFYFYNPVSNNQDAHLEIAISDDDNQNNTYENTADDSWRKSLVITGSAGWQLISVPLKDLNDVNPGGNGIFDVAFTQNKGMLLLVEFRFNKPVAAPSNAVFYIDMICFTDGSLPTGNTIFDLPGKDPQDHCFLGAFKNEPNGAHELIPQDIEGLFPAMQGKKLKYINTYIQFANDGSTVASALPGNAIQTLLNNGYLPIITWEPYFLGYAPLDPVQPRLSNIINGDYNAYIDLFADKIKTYSDTVIIRLMHEFEGDWYPWCISQNNQDPNLFITAYRKIVDRFRSKGVSNVLWMWCGNSDYTPYEAYNWMVKAYPGDNYIDLVATDIYNSIYPSSLPWWRSFRWSAAESYYYLTKYFPAKPLIICELACRERAASEPPALENKADWFARMDKELQSNFHKVRGLIFFNAIVGQDWNINTSAAAVTSLRDHLWYDDYYFKAPSVLVSLKEHNVTSGLSLYPNPSPGLVNIQFHSGHIKAGYQVRILNALGSTVYSETFKERGDPFTMQIDLGDLPAGVYFIELKEDKRNAVEKEPVREIRKLVLR